jgi:uncharacterized protein (DUF1786 family)
MVLPSPTMMVAQRVKQATREGQPLLLTGVIMGGGPSTWATRDHAKAGHPVYAIESAARSFDDDLDVVRDKFGVTVVSEDEASRLNGDVLRLELRDFDYAAVAATFAQYGVELELDGVAVAVFDHGNAPPDESDRQFRFDYLDEHIQAHNRLSAFAFDADQVPSIMTRMGAVVDSAALPDGLPLMVMDTAPAAVLGATLDPQVASHQQVMIANVGNFHTLAFRLGASGIEGVFEHHTGEINRARLDELIGALADSTLKHEDVFGDQGHGALIYDPQPASSEGRIVAVTGPRRAMMVGSAHKPYFAVPYGDMMIAGCFGLVRAFADVYPERQEVLLDALGGAERGAPWELL